jgi:hypothetical protein
MSDGGHLTRMTQNETGERIGGIKIAGDDYVAFDADGKKLGRFADQTSAAFAIVAAAERSGDGV